MVVVKLYIVQYIHAPSVNHSTSSSFCSVTRFDIIANFTALVITGLILSIHKKSKEPGNMYSENYQRAIVGHIP